MFIVQPQDKGYLIFKTDNSFVTGTFRQIYIAACWIDEAIQPVLDRIKPFDIDFRMQENCEPEHSSQEEIVSASQVNQDY